MPFSGNRTGNAKTWFCLNPGEAVSTIVFQNLGPFPIEVKLAATGTVPPTDREGKVVYEVGDAMGSDEQISDRLKGVATPAFVWAISEESVTVSVGY